MPGVYHGYMGLSHNALEMIAYKEEQKQAFDLWIRDKKSFSDTTPSLADNMMKL